MGKVLVALAVVGALVLVVLRRANAAAAPALPAPVPIAPRSLQGVSATQLRTVPPPPPPPPVQHVTAVPLAPMPPPPPPPPPVVIVPLPPVPVYVTPPAPVYAAPPTPPAVRRNEFGETRADLEQKIADIGAAVHNFYMGGGTDNSDTDYWYADLALAQSRLAAFGGGA